MCFWAICFYLFFEYVRPQSIFRWLDFMPWAQLFIVVSATTLFLDKTRHRVRDSTNVWMVLFAAVIVISSLIAYDPAYAQKHYIDFFGWFVVYFLITNIVNNEKRFFIFLIIFLLCSFKLAQHGARTWAMRGFSFTNWGLMGPEGPFHNSGELASQMLIFTPLCYQFAVALKPWLSTVKYYLLMLGPLAGAMTVLGSSTRGGQIALVVQSYLVFLKGRMNLKTIAAVCALAWVGWTMLPDQQKARFTEAGQDETSQQRLLYWKNGVEMIKEHPVLGVGYFNFVPYYAEHYPHDILFGTAQLPHNIFIQVGTDVGLLGLALYLGLMYRAFRCTRDVRKCAADNPQLHFYIPLTKGFDVAFVGFIIAGQFVTIGYYPFMWIHLAMVVALRNVVLRKAAAQAAASAGAGLGSRPANGIQKQPSPAHRPAGARRQDLPT